MISSQGGLPLRVSLFSLIGCITRILLPHLPLSVFFLINIPLQFFKLNIMLQMLAQKIIVEIHRNSVTGL